VDGEKLFRGFIVWNSEVGKCVFGVTTFLYRFVCDNRIIWNASQVKELRIRHTKGAPERFAREGAKFLAEYAEESTKLVIEGVRTAKNTVIENPSEKNSVETWLRERGFTKNEATKSVEFAKAEEGQARSLWDIVNGVTAYARSLQHSDERVDLETRAGELLPSAA